ncbi:15119_t:CDS:2 [Acaulospora morrowiae]|uniref:Ceramide very long chain fatty acid hydroxylase n=1 Tax=Acaulospora morrowiae TaxID=94023 RepID=A0A9N9G3G2_9GLOM|nr:15119_t:CDS:2 [Acaulospora morrowiae]
MPGRMLFRYTREEVGKHNRTDDLWVIHNNKVYDVTEFVLDHPGGADLIVEWAGKDITKVLNDPDSHEHSEVAYEALGELCIGEIVDNNTSTTKVATISPQSQVSKNYTADDKFHSATTNIQSDLKEKFLDLSRPLFYQMFNCDFTKEFYLQQIHKPRHLPYSVKLFESPYLEILTKTPWYVIPIIWIPVVYYHASMASENLGLNTISVLFVIGIWIWTLLEYALHRFVFHVDNLLPDHPYALSLHFTLHGIHHYLPMDRMRLVMPPILGGTIAIPIMRAGYFIFPESITHALIAGAVFGYICYDMTHYYLHHARPFGQHLQEMKTYHLNHHYKNYELGYGITSKFWDKMFNTVL